MIYNHVDVRGEMTRNLRWSQCEYGIAVGSGGHPYGFGPKYGHRGCVMGETTTPLVAEFVSCISPVYGVSARQVFMGEESIGAFSWSLSQRLIVKLSRPRMFSIR